MRFLLSTARRAARRKPAGEGSTGGLTPRRSPIAVFPDLSSVVPIGAVVATLALAAVSGADRPPASRGLDALVRVLASSDDAAVWRDVVRGMHEGLQGRRQVAAPAGWAAVYRKLRTCPDKEVR